MAQAAIIGLQMGMQLFQGVGENNAARSQANALDENARLTETQGAWDAAAALRKASQGPVMTRC